MHHVTFPVRPVFFVLGEQGITQTKLNTMEESYTVAWAVVNEDDKGITDYWERCETLEEAQDLYTSVRDHNRLYTASIGKEIQSTEL